MAFSKELIARSSGLLKHPEVLAMYSAYRGMVTNTLHDHGLLASKSPAEAAAGAFASLDGAEWLGWTEAHDPHTGHLIHLAQTISIEMEGSEAGQCQLLLKLSFPDGDGSEAVYPVFILPGDAQMHSADAHLDRIIGEVLEGTTRKAGWLEEQQDQLQAWLAQILTP